MPRLAAVAVEILSAALVCACARADDAGSPSGPPIPASTARSRAHESSPFACDAGVCVQLHVRLPDEGEWRCAERDGVVWCAGGEPAAGVVHAARDRGYVCGARRGSSNGERVCVDAAPDYPDDGRGAFRCHFESDFGVTRVCQIEQVKLRPAPRGSAPDCWLDGDCSGKSCDRGYCLESAR